MSVDTQKLAGPNFHSAGVSPLTSATPYPGAVSDYYYQPSEQGPSRGVPGQAGQNTYQDTGPYSEDRASRYDDPSYYYSSPRPSQVNGALNSQYNYSIEHYKQHAITASRYLSYANNDNQEPPESYHTNNQPTSESYQPKGSSYESFHRDATAVTESSRPYHSGDLCTTTAATTATTSVLCSPPHRQRQLSTAGSPQSYNPDPHHLPQTAFHSQVTVQPSPSLPSTTNTSQAGPLTYTSTADSVSPHTDRAPPQTDRVPPQTDTVSSHTEKTMTITSIPQSDRPQQSTQPAPECQDNDPDRAPSGFYVGRADEDDGRLTPVSAGGPTRRLTSDVKPMLPQALWEEAAMTTSTTMTAPKDQDLASKNLQPQDQHLPSFKSEDSPRASCERSQPGVGGEQKQPLKSHWKSTMILKEMMQRESEASSEPSVPREDSRFEFDGPTPSFEDLKQEMEEGNSPSSLPRLSPVTEAGSVTAAAGDGSIQGDTGEGGDTKAENGGEYHSVHSDATSPYPSHLKQENDGNLSKSCTDDDAVPDSDRRRSSVSSLSRSTESVYDGEFGLSKSMMRSPETSYGYPSPPLNHLPQPDCLDPQRSLAGGGTGIVAALSAMSAGLSPARQGFGVRMDAQGPSNHHPHQGPGKLDVYYCHLCTFVGRFLSTAHFTTACIFCVFDV